MKIVYFTHSLLSCWNHGNAHFVRGVLRDLIARGHDVTAYEPQGAWSLANLLADHGDAGLIPFRREYPELRSQTYTGEAQWSSSVDAADLVIVHEWNDPSLVADLGRRRAQGGGFTLLFHDTHHRAVSDPAAIRAFDLSDYDGVLAFGEALSDVYRSWGWAGRVWTWHEAADLRLFKPPADETRREGLVWVGNWGDDERSNELNEFLFQPVRAADLQLDVYGVRYPPAALEMLAANHIRYRGWIPNALTPAIYARHLATVHVPRRQYATLLPGIPTIRVFEALACGIPLVCAPWEDTEGLFRAGQDYLLARSQDEMIQHLRAIRENPGLRAALAQSGLETVGSRHSCAHRVDELLGIVAELRKNKAPEEARISA